MAVAEVFRLANAFLLSIILGWLATPPLAAQDAPEQPYRLQVGAQLVLVDASVEWKKTGKPVSGLTAGDFEVLEDEAPQRVSSVSVDQLPLSVLFLFDLTDTVHPVLQHLADGAAEVLRQLRPDDEIAVMTFSSHTDVQQRFTRDKMLAREAVDAASASYDKQEPTFIFEDLWEASLFSERSRLQDARRVQIWVTDGSANDQDTERGLAHQAPERLHSEEQATAELLRSGAVVSELVEKSNLRGTGRFGDIERYASMTGGPVLYATQHDASARLTELLAALRARYTLAYKPGRAKPEGTLCKIRVRLSAAFWAGHPAAKPSELIVRSRSSYLRSGPTAEQNP